MLAVNFWLVPFGIGLEYTFCFSSQSLIIERYQYQPSQSQVQKCTPGWWVIIYLILNIHVDRHESMNKAFLMCFFCSWFNLVVDYPRSILPTVEIWSAATGAYALSQSLRVDRNTMPVWHPDRLIKTCSFELFYVTRTAVLDVAL